MTDQSTLARKVLLDILASPETFKMDEWYKRGTETEPPTACLATKAALVSGWQPHFAYETDYLTSRVIDPKTQQTRLVEELAAELFGIEGDIVYDLFWCTNRIAALTILDRAAQGEKITRDMVWEENRRDYTIHDTTYDHMIEELRDKYAAALEALKTETQTPPVEVKEESFHFVLQRLHIGARGEQWVDSSANYYREEGEQAAIMQLDELRKTFGDEVRMVRRTVTITEQVINR